MVHKSGKPLPNELVRVDGERRERGDGQRRALFHSQPTAAMTDHLSDDEIALLDTIAHEAADLLGERHPRDLDPVSDDVFIESAIKDALKKSGDAEARALAESNMTMLEEAVLEVHNG